MKTRILASVAARRFSEILNRVGSGGESFVVERYGKLVCAIVPPRPTNSTWADLAALVKSLPRPDKEYLKILEDLTLNQPKIGRGRIPHGKG